MLQQHSYVRDKLSIPAVYNLLLNCSFSLEPEEIVALDESDPTLVRANIESVVEMGMPYTQLGEGDNRVRRNAAACLA